MTICVCGAGTMGAGIAQTAAQHGFMVKLFDLNSAVLQNAKELLIKNLQSLIERQKITVTEMESISNRIQFVTEGNQCKAGIIIEAIIEELPEKIALFHQMASLNGPEAVYASNTSSIGIAAIAAAHDYPGKFAGMHFFNPATIMKLVEIVEHPKCDPETIKILFRLASDLGKTPVVCKDAPGFIVNRVARPFYIESLRLAEEGVPISTIDALMIASAFKMGPFALMDLIGNDINYAVSCSVYDQLGKPERLKPSYMQQQKVIQGKLGRKSGAGFYTYNP